MLFFIYQIKLFEAEPDVGARYYKILNEDWEKPSWRKSESKSLMDDYLKHGMKFFIGGLVGPKMKWEEKACFSSEKPDTCICYSCLRKTYLEGKFETFKNEDLYFQHTDVEPSFMCDNLINDAIAFFDEKRKKK